MAANTTGQMRIKSTDQETMDELRSMFPELTHEEISDLMIRFQGDLTQIVDKLLQNPSPPSSKVATIALSPSTGNSTHHGSISVSSPSNALLPSRITALTPSEASDTSLHSPWGPKAALGLEQSQVAFPSAFSGPIPTGSPAKHPAYVASNPVYTSTQEIVASSPTSSNKSSNKGLEGPRSISPPKTPIRPPRHDSPSLEPSISHQVSGTPPSSAPIPAHLQSNPAATAQLLASFESAPVAFSPSHPVMQLISPVSTNKSTTPEPRSSPAPSVPGQIPSPASSQHSSIFASPANGAYPSHDPSTILLSNPLRSPLSTTGSKIEGSPFSASSLSSSRLGADERSARLRAAEMQFQSLLASMSELEASSQHESDLKDSRISTLEQDLKSLSSEKATWVSRLQQVSQTSLSLRDQLAEKTKEADQLRQQLKEQEAANAALRAKLLSYRPLEAAEQLRSEFETSISRALAQGDDSTRESMEIFARTFQQAFASALSSAKPSSSGNE